MEKRAALYIRVSSSDQSNSVSSQTDKLKKYCDYNDISIVSILEDEDVSGGKKFSERPSGSKVIDLIKSRTINCIVSTKIDRLFRNTADSLLTVEEWNNRGVALHLADLSGVSLDTSSANGKFFFTIMASSAAYERDKTSERIKDVLDHKKTNMKCCSSAPLGFDISGRIKDENGKVIFAGDLVPNLQEQKIVREIFRMKNSGKSINNISSHLNSIETPSKEGGKYYATTIQKILNNNIYQSIKN